MTSFPDRWSDSSTTGFVASSVNKTLVIGAADRMRHVRVVGNLTFLPKPTNVQADDGALVGVVAVFPDVAPPAPSFANRFSWDPGWWGRPPVTAVEAVYWPPAGGLPGYRWHFAFEFSFMPPGEGVAGALYIGHQQIYVDANHTAPNFSYSVDAWGYAP